MNSRKNIIKRNRDYLSNYFSMSENQWLEFMKLVGKPDNKFGASWSPENPTSGWCGGVTMALRISGKIPEGYIACRQKDDAHYYIVNPSTEEVIDLTIYQMSGEYEHDYLEYNIRFMNVLSKNVKKLLKALDLKIDESKFILNRKNNHDYICKMK
jgi:hypothetical protein